MYIGDTVKIVYNSKNPEDAGIVGDEGDEIRINYYLNIIITTSFFIMGLVEILFTPKKNTSDIENSNDKII